MIEKDEIVEDDFNAALGELRKELLEAGAFEVVNSFHEMLELIDKL